MYKIIRTIIFIIVYRTYKKRSWNACIYGIYYAIIIKKYVTRNEERAECKREGEREREKEI